MGLIGRRPVKKNEIQPWVKIKINLWFRRKNIQKSKSDLGAVVAQLASARLSEREFSGSIVSDFNVSFDFPLIRVAIALNTRKTEHWQRQGV